MTLIEEFLDKGLMFDRLWHASQFTPITLDNGVLILDNGKKRIGCKGYPIVLENIEVAIEEAYKMGGLRMGYEEVFGD